MIKSVISAGTKSQAFEGPIVKIGASNSIKLVAETLDLLGGKNGNFAFIADDTDDDNLFYIGVSADALDSEGARGSKLGVVGEKSKVSAENPNQLSFTHAVLGKKLHDKAATFMVNQFVKDEDGVDTEESAGFEHNGITYFPMTILQTREAAELEKKQAEEAKQAKSDKAEDAALAGTTGKKGGRKAQESAE